ncbi:hypothetical protein GM921_14115 [Pedobacter sp. LMG 31464]|uniref:DUF937 domain-containing protein n=1 Tax=Pedobacter planticolens TaxID=2679964 RepID=A0A923E339_9SPHI|nr:hypothetical protein [Pedobacter planticolens]MBB2146634.1 hypothetical protein [Pedobacter planticolens]
MLENLINLVKEHAQDAIVNNPDVPNEQNEEAVQAASSSIVDALKQQVSSGNLGGLMDVFKGNTGDVTQQATTGFVEKLQGMGINLGAAEGIAGSLIPGLIEKFTQKTNDPNDSSFNLQDIAGKLIGGDDGKFDLSDVTSMLGVGGNQTQADGTAAPSSGGILGKIKGLFS